jgi:two-component sensor histidine kinase
VPSGLIVQELVSNALKHAFPGGRRGQITVSLKQNGGDGFALGVRDDGVGLPEGARPEMSSSLGLRLVRILAEQVNATVECKSATGAEFSINFPNCA